MCYVVFVSPLKSAIMHKDFTSIYDISINCGFELRTAGFN